MSQEKERPVLKVLVVLRLAILLTGLTLALAIALLIKETAYVFSAFMFFGPLLLLAAVVLLGYVIFKELRHKQVI